VWLAHIDDVVVGYLVADLGDDHIVRIDQVWVTPEARELGFGDALLDAAIEGARGRGAVAVEGQALPGDRQTKNLYERAGIVARLITTYRAI
jgi:ribosomal protein S18 acetylase RimI-like enzyme